MIQARGREAAPAVKKVALRCACTTWYGITVTIIPAWSTRASGGLRDAGADLGATGLHALLPGEPLLACLPGGPAR
jgi:hypothetical protein